jgi:hypothetical protein
MVQDLAGSPDQMMKLKEMFDLSSNLGTMDGTHNVIGTPYHHEDIIQYLRSKKDGEGKLVYTTRLKPATVGGEPNGEPVLLPKARLLELQANKQMFFSQQLLDPSPLTDMLLLVRSLTMFSAS